MRPRTITSIRNNSIVPPRTLPALCLLLVIVSREIIFRNDASSSSSSSSYSTALAFPLSPLSFSPLSSTRIRSGLDDDAIENNTSYAPGQLQFESKQQQQQQQQQHQQQQQQQQRRRAFLRQSALVATAVVAPVSSMMMPTKPAYAISSVEAKLATLSAAKTSAEGSTMVFRKAKGGGLAQAIRVGLRFKMDELQRDLMQERWDLLQPYPAQLRSYVYIFTTYTDAAFPTDSPTDKDQRVTLRYEVGRFYGAVEKLKKAIAKQALSDAFTAYADMSLHFDRYLHTGGLYTYYESAVDNEDFVKGFNDALVYSDPIKDPAEVRDLVVLCKGPDKGKTGILIGIYPPTEATTDCVVKLDEYRGMREILVIPRSWAAKRLGEQAPDAVFSIPQK